MYLSIIVFKTQIYKYYAITLSVHWIKKMVTIAKRINDR